MKGEGLGVIENGAVCFEGNRIIAAGATPEMDLDGFRADRVIDGKGRLAVLPGFIDAHMHSAGSLLRGLAQDVPEIEWMHKTQFPFMPHFMKKHAIAGAKLSVLEGLRYGTTTFVDYGYPIIPVVEEVYMPVGWGVVATKLINAVKEVEEV